MHHHGTVGMIALGAALMLAPAAGQWHRAIPNGPRFDPSKPPGRGQGA